MYQANFYIQYKEFNKFFSIHQNKKYIKYEKNFNNKFKKKKKKKLFLVI